MTGNFFSLISSALISLLGSNGGFFLAAGLGFLVPLVVLRLAILGLMSWGGSLDPWTFIKEMGLILATVAVMAWYGSPMPWSSVTFPHLIIDEAKSLSNQLEGGLGSRADAKLNQAIAQIEMPTSKGWVPTLQDLISGCYYFVLQILIGVEKLMLLVALAASFVALAVVDMFGPLLIPWVLFPGLEGLAWGWLNSMLRYASIQVVASAVVFINGSVLLSFFTVYPLPWKADDLAPNCILFSVVVIGAVYVTTWIPSIAGSLMGGYAHTDSVIRTRSI